MTAHVATLDAFVPEEESVRPGRETYTGLVARLSRQSVTKHFDAYADIDWDADDFRIDPTDPRWELDEEDVLGGSAWYRNQPPAVRARIGLHLVASFMKIGLQFEGVLKQGLLLFAADLPNRAPEFRYVYHEIIEEAQHSLMFQEFVNRSGFDLPGMTGRERVLSRWIPQLARRFPELFFMFVLGGEDPIDHVQRRALRRKATAHPLLRRIMQIHVTEEARHLCFARHYLKERVPQLGAVKRRILAVGTPIILGEMAKLMMRPSPAIVREYAIPADVVRDVYTRNPVHRKHTLDALEKVRVLCGELGLLGPRSTTFWRLLGIAA
ncbi:MAG TPA: diiron oxygenase [Candidatus Binatia bacterium]|nr:diiron oxygenase [Candidatus Binatia bacterium]